MLDMKPISELAREVGVQAYRIAYAVQTGALPAPQIVAGRRFWTPEEARSVKEYFDRVRSGPRRGRPARDGRPNLTTAAGQ